MKLAIMQPYFLPYIGYFQLVAGVDTFVVYDNIKYTKKGWINRNRLLRNGEAVTFSIPLQKDSDFLDVRDRRLAADFDRKKLLNMFKGAYEPAPFFQSTMPLIREIVEHEETNLFRFLRHSIVKTCEHLGIGTKIVDSSDVPIDHSLKGEQRVIALCEALGATMYVNPIGGTELYLDSDFAQRGIELRFLKSEAIEYAQFGHPFVPRLSIVDLMMFNPPERVDGWIRSRTYSEFVTRDQAIAASPGSPSGEDQP
jgi:hypothetical protein